MNKRRSAASAKSSAAKRPSRLKKSAAEASSSPSDVVESPPAASQTSSKDDEDANLLEALAFFATRSLDLDAITPGDQKDGNSTPPSPPKDVVYDAHLPLGLTLYRYLRVGAALEEAIEELDDALNLSQTEEVLRNFDLCAYARMKKIRVSTDSQRFRIIDGYIYQYKNIEGTWIFFIQDLRFKDKRRVFYSPMTKIVAAEKFALDWAVKHPTQRRSEPRFSAAELFFSQDCPPPV